MEYKRVIQDSQKLNLVVFLKTIFMRLLLSLRGMKMTFIPHAQNYNICIA